MSKKSKEQITQERINQGVKISSIEAKGLTKMKDEYIIINKTQLLKRIEELKIPIAHHDGIYVSDAQRAEYEALEEVISKSTPLIPEIEKDFDAVEKSADWRRRHLNKCGCKKIN